MTILPKKKHQESKRNEQDHDDHRTRQSRARSSREIRTRAQHSSTNEDLSNISEGGNSRLVVGAHYNDLETIEHQQPSFNRGSQNYYLAQTNNNVRSELVSPDDDLEDDEDGYNSSDEHGPLHQGGVKKKDFAVENQHEREIEFERQLHERKGFSIKQMATDGACMFRAVADQVYGDQEMHSVVRKHCMDYMVKNRDYFSQYMTEDFASYIRRKRNEHAHGNHIEMQALSEMYNRPIEVYQYSCEPINTFHSRSFYHDDNAPIRLSYHGNIHYNSIVDPYNPTVGVGLGLAGYKPGMTNETLNKTLKESEAHMLEKEMLEDKIKATDWEATDEQIAELAARESYLQWLKDSQKNSSNGASSSAGSSTQSRKSPSRDNGTHPRKSPSYENRRTPPYENRRSPQYENTNAPSYELRQSPSYENKKSPINENKNNIPDKKHSPSPGQRKSPPGEPRTSLSNALPGCSNSNRSSNNNQRKENAEKPTSPGSIAGASADWSLALGYDLEFENDPVLAAVLAQSQQEYLDSLSRGHTDSNSECPPKLQEN